MRMAATKERGVGRREALLSPSLSQSPRRGRLRVAPRDVGAWGRQAARPSPIFSFSEPPPGAIGSNGDMERT